MVVAIDVDDGVVHHQGNGGLHLRVAARGGVGGHESFDAFAEVHDGVGFAVSVEHFGVKIFDGCRVEFDVVVPGIDEILVAVV